MKTISYLEIFTFLLFFGTFITRSLIMQLRGIKVFALARGKSMREKMLEMLFLPAFFSWAILLAYLIFSGHPGRLPSWISEPFFRSDMTMIMAAVLLIATLVFFIGALISFGDSWRVGIDDSTPGTLVRRGVFALSRNPIFLSINLYMIGTALLHPSWFFLAAALMVPAGIHIQILNEEKYLDRLYGQDYAEYKKKTPRYLLV